jgi:hypothetical protein
MEIPLWIILIPLGIIVALTALFLFFNVFHLWRYGIVHHGATALIAAYMVSYAFIFIIGLSTLSAVPWTRTVSISDLLPFSSTPSSSTFGL